MAKTNTQNRPKEHNHPHPKDALLGLAVGDALGVPVEFILREDLEIFPVKNMRGYGTHHQPPGTWSDDSSLTFCLVESLIEGYSATDLGQRMVDWYKSAYWTPHGEVFDIGNSTREAIERIGSGQVAPVQAGGREHFHNGNGSLMRVLPLVFSWGDKSSKERYEWVQEVSSLTHGHLRSVFSCFLYLEIAHHLYEGANPMEAYKQGIKSAASFATEQRFPEKEMRLFERVLDGRLPHLQRFQIHSSGYVIHSLEASLWSLLTSRNYEECVLKAVNLGADTDTNGAIAGGLAGLTYGQQSIPMDWLSALQRRSDIFELADRFYASLNTNGASHPGQEGMVA